MYDEIAKSSIELPMFSHDPGATLQEHSLPGSTHWTAFAPMLALHTPDPALGLPSGTALQPNILIRNTTNKPLPANLTLNWRGDSGRGQVQLPALTLAPYATQQIQIGPMQKQPGIPDDAHWALITLAGPASPNDVVATAFSTDATGKYNLETRFSEGLGGHFAGGEWRADSTHNQVLSVTNSGQKPADALLTLHYNDGKNRYEIKQTLQPAEQMWVNVADRIRNRLPDRNGNTLPTDVTFGTYDLRELSPGLGSLLLGNLDLGGAFGFAAQPPLATCCGFYDPSYNPDSIDVVVDGIESVYISGVDSCNNGGYDISAYFLTWWSSSPAIAQVTKKSVQGMATGTTTGWASGYVWEGYGTNCADVPVQVSAPITVQIPTSATILTNAKQTYTNQTWTSCDGTQNKSNEYGYQRCVTYQVNDQFGEAIESTLTISETVTVVDQNINANMNSGNSTTNVAGQFLDGLVLIGTAALPSNACDIVKQSITASGNTSAIRVNCLQYSATDVTITDVTANPTSCSKPTYECK